MAKITISLPDDLLHKLESRRKARKQTRSEFFRHALERRMHDDDEAALSAEYRRGYQLSPETPEEIDEARALSSGALAHEPWE